jgi:hypothetical protein
MYVAADTSSNVHVYGLPLDSSSVPTVAPIGSFSQALGSNTLSQVICATAGAQTNIQTPTTLFAVLDVAGSGGCGTNDTFSLINYTDASSTAPTTLPTTITGISVFEPLYSTSSYALTELVLFDSTNHNVDIYPYSSGTPLTGAPTHAVTTVNSATVLHNTAQQGVLFLDVTLTSAPTQHLIYRINSGSTTATLAYTAAAAGNTFTTNDDPDDGTNLYFIDNGPTSQLLVQVGVSGGSPVTLYTNAGTNMSLLVANGTNVLVALQTTATSQYQWSFYPFVVGTANQALPASPSQLTAASLTSFTGEQSAGKPNTRVALVNISASAGVGVTEYFSVIVNAAGSAVGASNQAVPNSQFLVGGGGFQGSSPYALQVIGITDPQVTYGGGKIYPVPLATGVPGTALTLTGSSTYVIPSGTLLAAVTFATQIGEIYDISGASNGTTYAFDLSLGQMSAVTLPNEAIAPF